MLQYFSMCVLVGVGCVHFLYFVIFNESVCNVFCLDLTGVHCLKHNKCSQSGRELRVSLVRFPARVKLAAIGYLHAIHLAV